MRPGGLVEMASNDEATAVAVSVVSAPAADPVVGHAVGPESPKPSNNGLGERSYLVQEYLPPGAYARFVAANPLVTAVGVLAILAAFSGIVGIPGYFAILEGNNARDSYEAGVNNAFEMTVDWARGNMSDDPNKVVRPTTVKVVEPFTEEVDRQRLVLIFESRSGDILTAKNIQMMKALGAEVQAIVSAHCLRYASTHVLVEAGSVANGGCIAPRTIMDTTGTEDPDELKEMLKNPEMKGMLQPFLGTNTDFVNGKADWAQIFIPIGGPLPGFDNRSHDEPTQRKTYQTLFKQAGSTGMATPNGWIPKIEKRIAKWVDDEETDTDVFWGGFETLLARMFSGLIFDVCLAIGSLVFVGLFMWVQTGSVFLCLAGMFEVIFSFVLSLSTWKVFGNESFTFMHALVIYIILGVGADDVFVFLDAWKQSRAQPFVVSGSTAARFSWTLQRSFNAMVVTSTTTCVAFTLTTLTDMPIVSTFGTFAAIVIIWNLFLVCTWFAACVVVHDTYLVRGCYAGSVAAHTCGCCCVCCAGQWGLDREEEEEASGEEGLAMPRVNHDHDPSKLRGIEAFFHTTFFNFVSSHRNSRIIFVVFTAFAITGVACACTGVKLTTKALTETYLVERAPIQKTLNILVGTHKAWKVSANGRKKYGSFVLGLDSTAPMDRSGTNPLMSEEFESQMGVPRFNGENLTSVAAQLGMVDACEKIAEISSVQPGRNGKSNPEVICFIQDFKRYQLANSLPFPVAPPLFVAALYAWRFNNTCSAKETTACYTTQDGEGVSNWPSSNREYDRATGFLADEDRKEIKMAWFSGNLTEGYREQNMNIIGPEYEEWQAAASKPGTAGALTVIGLTGRLEWVATMKALVNGVVSGVPVSVGSSGLILCFFTANWRIAVIATVTIIGVISSFMFTFVLAGWVLGMYECMFLQLTAGMAVDYVVHLAHAYNECPAWDRESRMRASLTEMGVSVLSGGISTLGASVCLFLCNYNVFYLYGSFIFTVIGWAIVWALFFFPCAMLAVGPQGTEGDIPIIRRLFAYLGGRKSGGMRVPSAAANANLSSPPSPLAISAVNADVLAMPLHAEIAPDEGKGVVEMTSHIGQTSGNDAPQSTSSSEREEIPPPQAMPPQRQESPTPVVEVSN